MAKTIFGAKVADPAKTADSPESSSGANKPTIGETSISTQEVGRIQKEVHAVMHEQFAKGRAALRANCCALCPGVVDWHNCGNVLGALETGRGLVLDNVHSLCDIYRGNGAPLIVVVVPRPGNVARGI